ncbi:hypothetical protein [Nonlabens sp. Asnod3-A02]|uniref:hypothetical protein n=1 Tax=Nonlabens sp. Asnod3-A02 TaxID=3160579 RepID=UPI003863B653
MNKTFFYLILAVLILTSCKKPNQSRSHHQKQIEIGLEKFLIQNKLFLISKFEDSLYFEYNNNFEKFINIHNTDKSESYVSIDNKKDTLRLLTSCISENRLYIDDITFFKSKKIHRKTSVLFENDFHNEFDNIVDLHSNYDYYTPLREKRLLSNLLNRKEIPIRNSLFPKIIIDSIFEITKKDTALINFQNVNFKFNNKNELVEISKVGNPISSIKSFNFGDEIIKFSSVSKQSIDLKVDLWSGYDNNLGVTYLLYRKIDGTGDSLIIKSQNNHVIADMSYLYDKNTLLEVKDNKKNIKVFEFISDTIIRK